MITPVYNHEKFIAQTIKSVQSQTYRNWELLIVDDCSNDNSWEIIQKFAKKDKRIKAFRNNKNKGLIPNWEFLINNSRGAYIAFLEGDDVFYSNNLEKKIKIFEKYPKVGMVYCNFDIINTTGAIVLRNYYKKHRIKTYENQKIKADEYLLSRIAPFSSYSQIMIRRNIIKNGILPRSLDSRAKVFLPSDWDYNFRVSINNNIFFINASLLGYRKHDSNNSADFLNAEKHYNLLLDDYDKSFFDHKDVLIGVLYQRGKIKYLKTLYFLEKNDFSVARRVFFKYVINHPRNVVCDLKQNIKVLIRLFLPKKINNRIINKYYGR